MKQRNFLDKDTMHGTLSGARKRGRPHTTWMDNMDWGDVATYAEDSIAEDRNPRLLCGQSSELGRLKLKRQAEASLFLNKLRDACESIARGCQR